MTADRLPAHRVQPSRHRRAKGLVLLLCAGVFLLAGAPAALGQADYTGVGDPPPPGGTYVDPVYVDTHAGTETSPVAVVRLPAPAPPGGSGGLISVATGGLDDSSLVADGDRRLITGSDVAAMAALGLTAVAAFVFVSGRFRFH